jgi:UDP-glucose 4-epimerase
MCGKAQPFRSSNLQVFEATPQKWRRSLQIQLRTRYGKAEPYRTSGGKAATAAFVLDFPLEISSTFERHNHLRVLITGGAGFIGSHLSDAYVQRGDEVFVIDDLSTGSIDNIRHLKDHPRFHYTIDNVQNLQATAELVDQCDVIFHLAAAVGVKLIVESPVRTIETNVHCTEVILSLANKKKKKVLIASTSEVYGLSAEVPFREDGNLVMGATTKGRWSYACSKAIDEFLALAYWREKKLPTVVVRLFNTVGPRQTGQYGMVIPTFVKQALAGRPITVYGNGKQSRCFCYVGDVVGALMKLMDDPKAVGEVFNVGSNVEISIMGLAKKVKDLTNSESELVLVPYDEAYEEGFEDMPRHVPDISKVKKQVGFQPQLDLEGILKSVIDFHSGKQSAAKSTAAVKD